MVPEKKYEELIQRLQQLEADNKKLKARLDEWSDDKFQSNRDYESYFNNSLDGIFILESIYGVPSSFVEVNDALARMLGYSKNEIIEFDPLDILAEGEKKKLLNIAENILEQQEIYFLTAFRNSKKQRIPVEISIKTLDTSLNPQLIGVARNVDDKDYALKLKDSTEVLLTKIAAGSNEMFMHISGKQSFRINYVSPACRKILGFTENELYINPNIFLRNMHPDDYKSFMKLMESTTGTGLPHTFRFLRKDEKLIWIEVYLTNENKLTPLKHGVYAIIHDVTYRQQMERLINKKLKAEHLLSEISSSFIEYKKVKSIIHKTIQNTGITMDVDGIDLCVGKGNEVKNKYTWTNPNVVNTLKKDVLLFEGTPWIDSRLSKGDFVYLAKPDDIPSQYQDERKMLTDNGVKSMLASPLQFYGRTFGYLAFYQFDKKREWDRVEINLINTMAGIINSALRKEIILEEKDDIYRIALELKAFVGHPYQNKRPSLIFSFNKKGEITGCLGKHPLLSSDLKSNCDFKHLSAVFSKEVSLEMKEHYLQMKKEKKSMFFSFSISPSKDIQEAGMFFYKENKSLLCLYS